MQNNKKSPIVSSVQQSFSLITELFVEERNRKINLENKLLDSALEQAQHRARRGTESVHGAYEQHRQGNNAAWWAAYDANLKAEFLLLHQHDKAGTLAAYVSDFSPSTVA